MNDYDRVVQSRLVWPVSEGRWVVALRADSDVFCLPDMTLWTRKEVEAGISPAAITKEPGPALREAAKWRKPPLAVSIAFDRRPREKLGTRLAQLGEAYLEWVKEHGVCLFCDLTGIRHAPGCPVEAVLVAAAPDAVAAIG